MGPAILYLLIFGAFLAGLLFFVRLLCAPFSPKILEQTRRHRMLHCVWGCFALFSAFMLFLTLNPYAWPPTWWWRHKQRVIVIERLQSAGGWTALKRDCDALANTYKDDPYGFRWLRGDTNALPPAIAALKPKEVEFYPPKVLQPIGTEREKWHGSNAVMRISIFGAHSTGGRDQPWLWLEVLCEPGVISYSHSRLRSTTPLRYWKYRKITDNIYEYY